MLRSMGMLEAIAARVTAGAVVQFRPAGNSMVPLIRSKQVVTVAPVDVARLDVGDIVLTRVAGATYLHLVSALDAANRRVQISNNRGRVNGWTNFDRVYGICTSVDGVERPGARGKVLERKDREDQADVGDAAADTA
jgi:hypothetical protein